MNTVHAAGRPHPPVERRHAGRRLGGARSALGLQDRATRALGLADVQLGRWRLARQLQLRPGACHASGHRREQFLHVALARHALHSHAGGQPADRRRADQPARSLARRACRRFHARCFWSCPPDPVIGAADVAQVAEQLMRYGGCEAWEKGAGPYPRRGPSGKCVDEDRMGSGLALAVHAGHQERIVWFSVAPGRSGHQQGVGPGRPRRTPPTHRSPRPDRGTSGTGAGRIPAGGSRDPCGSRAGRRPCCARAP